MARGNIEDILGGLLFVTIGVTGAALSRSYVIGTADDMGPGYLPLGVFIILGALGAVIAIQGLVVPRGIGEGLDLRPALAIILGTGAFALLVRTAGFLAATMVLVVIVSLADKEARFGQSIIAGAVLAIFGTLVFSIGLGISLPVWPWSN